MTNPLKELFGELNQNRISYCVARKYEGLPYKIKGDVDIIVEKKDAVKILKLIEKKGFLLYPFTEPHKFYFIYNKESGLINLDIVVFNKLPEIKKYNNFYVPKKETELRIKKPFFRRIITNLKRKLHYLFRGRVIAFVGPDGCGKSTLSKGTCKAIKKFPIKKERIWFVTTKGSRILDLLLKIIKIHLNKITGRITITDRYIYLTFKNHKFLKKLVRFISVKPDMIILPKIDAKIIKKRKNELSEEDILKQYKLFEQLENVKKIDNTQKIPDVIEHISNEILKIVLN